MSSDAHQLVERLSRRFEISDETQQQLKSESSSSSNLSEASQTSASGVVGVGFTSTVSTFISQKNFSSFAVPQFASHWGAVCDFTPRDRYLFHLMFNQDWERSDPIRSRARIGSDRSLKVNRTDRNGSKIVGHNFYHSQHHRYDINHLL